MWRADVSNKDDIVLGAAGEDAKRRLTLHLSGISPSASGRRALSVFCTMEEVMATPQTVPRDRSRYTVDTETA
jgi:hypothetical protein